MLDSAPGPGFSFLGLLETVADHLGFRRGERFIPVNKPLRLHRDAPSFRRNFHEIPLLESHGIENLLRNDNLAPLTDTAERGDPTRWDLNASPSP